MIIPTPQFDPLFAVDDIPFRSKMLDYIEREFSELLTPGTLAALNQPSPKKGELLPSNQEESTESRKVA